MTWTNDLTTLLFWSSLAVVVYTYAGYPLLLRVYSGIRCVETRKGGNQPFISVVIAVYNEERNIAARIANILAQDYPADKVEVVVVSDGSDDATGEKTRSFAGGNVRLVELDKRQGKASAIARGVAEARGEVIVFADARQSFEPDAVSQLVANFSDPDVGCASGELVFYDDAGCRTKTEMGAYWKYEKWIRKNESATGSVAGATGAIYAIRRELFPGLPAKTILDDVYVPLAIIGQGYRCIFDGDAVAYDSVYKDTAQEWRRKTRTLSGNWQLLSLRPAFLNPVSNPCWWRFMSHKIMRLLVPFFLVTLLFSGAALTGGIYRVATAGQVLLYFAALAGLVAPATRGFRAVSLCYFFIVMNAAAATGFWIWITGRSGDSWKTASDAARGRADGKSVRGNR